MCVARLTYLQLLNCFFTSLKMCSLISQIGNPCFSALSKISWVQIQTDAQQQEEPLLIRPLLFFENWLKPSIKKKVTVKTVTSAEWNKSAGSQEALIKHRCVRAPRPVWAPVPSLIFIPIPSPSPRPLALSHAGVALEIYPNEMGHSF